MNFEDAIQELLADQLGNWTDLIDLKIIIQLLEMMFETPLMGQPVSEVIHNLLGIFHK